MSQQIDPQAKWAVLSQPLFGEWVAEDESDVLHEYFYETAEFREFFAPHARNKNVVYGPKGSGKSAIYCLLSHPTPRLAEQLRKERVTIIEAEATRGKSVFHDVAGEFEKLMTDFTRSMEASSKKEKDALLDDLFVYLWKLYFLVLIGEKLLELGRNDQETEDVLKALRKKNLLPERDSNEERTFLMRAVIGVKDYVTGYLKRIQKIGMKVAPVGFEILFYKPSKDEEASGFTSVDSLLQSANNALKSAGITAWLTIDHLDLAFSSDARLENHAIGALLLKVYDEFRQYDHIRLKIFVRSDIWARLLEERHGQEDRIVDAQKIGRIDLTWIDERSPTGARQVGAKLVAVIMHRLARNKSLCEFYGVDPDKLLRDEKLQRNLFFSIMPSSVELNLNSIEWANLWLKDGSGQTTPRDLLHLLTEAQDIQWSSNKLPSGTRLLDAPALRDAQKRVSNHDYEQALLPENPELRPFIKVLEGKGVVFMFEELVEIWKTVKRYDQLQPATATEKASKLRDIGFFIQEEQIPLFRSLGLDDVNEAAYAVAPLYRHALNKKRSGGG